MDAADTPEYHRLEIPDFERSLTEATRARTSADVFVRPAGADDAEAAYNHFVFGQRGAGKSSLLRNLQAQQHKEGRAAVWIDQEVFTGLKYPDVLVSCVLEISEGLARDIRQSAERAESSLSRIRRVLNRIDPRNREDALSKQLDRMQANLRSIKFAPLDASIEWTHRAKSSSMLEVLGSVKIGKAAVSASSRNGEEGEVTKKQSIITNKNEYLERSLTDFRRVIHEASKKLGGGFVFVDDLYLIQRVDQPRVLGYLHRLLKDSGLSLKIGSIRYATNTYSPDDPPVGMQEGHDALEISLDRQFSYYTTTKTFLESILTGIASKAGVDAVRLYTHGALDRLMLASGGVARDYLRLARLSIAEAKDRGPTPKAGSNRVTVEDVNAAAGKIAPSKMEDLRKDTPDEADALQRRVIDLTEFCRDRRSAYFLVDIEDRALMNDMSALQHLRFAHLLFQSESVPERGSQRFNLYLLDIAQLSYQRATQGIDFDGWRDRGKRRNRKLVYSSDWAKPTPKPRKTADRGDGRLF